MDKVLYLGDAVYARISEDLALIHLSLSDHRNPPVVALELEVLEMLILFAKAHGWRLS